MGVKMGWIQIKMGHPLAQSGAALAPFRANGAHTSSVHLVITPCAHAQQGLWCPGVVCSKKFPKIFTQLLNEK